jgi:phosphate transporter
VKSTRLLVSVGVFVCFYFSKVLPAKPFAHRCLALLAFTISMWSSEAIPYFATSLLVPVLVILLRVLEVG